MAKLFAQETAAPKNPKKIIFAAKRLNFRNGKLDLQGMEQKLQKIAYKNQDEEIPIGGNYSVTAGRQLICVPQQANVKPAIKPGTAHQ